MPLALVDLRGVDPDRFRDRLPRPSAPGSTVAADVVAILAKVRAGGDGAVREFGARFDGVVVDDLRVPPAEVEAARGRLPDELRGSLETAWERIVAYHRHEAGSRPDDYDDGLVHVTHLLRAVRRAGLYAPGGRALYPSTVLMCAAPARVAGVEALALCAPPGPDGRIATLTLGAAAIAGVDEVYRIGGAQAIGAMAYGTETVAAVDVIAGPGNAYVAEAKRQVAGVVGVASAFAGPSEVVVLADGSSPVEWTAIDLVVQAEHGPDGLAWLVTWDPDVASAVSDVVDGMVAASPRRADLERTLDDQGYAVLVDDARAAVAVANVVAAEHLQLHVREPERLLDGIRSAGAVFLGAGAPASVGDYVAGVNHVLPTARTARFSSALRVDDFRTRIHAVALAPGALDTLGPHVIAIADAEGLPAHADAVRLRAGGAT